MQTKVAVRGVLSSSKETFALARGRRDGFAKSDDVDEVQGEKEGHSVPRFDEVSEEIHEGTRALWLLRRDERQG